MRKEYDWSKAKPNRFVTNKKVPVSIRLDAEVIHWLKEESQRLSLRGYQTLANAILNDAMAQARAQKRPARKRA